jgi:hypothetical protein
MMQMEISEDKENKQDRIGLCYYAGQQPVMHLSSAQRGRPNGWLPSKMYICACDLTWTKLQYKELYFLLISHLGVV